ncbi:MAG TPA: ABC transporter permease [Terriglobales bacterium]|nr:ABC transporter permease [Terriglobales bacterium]
METLLQDIRYGFRMLKKSPAFTVVAVITLALGIGANTTIFSMVDSFLLRPLPVQDAGQLTVLSQTVSQVRKNDTNIPIFSIAEYRDLRNQMSGIFSGLLAYQYGMDGLSANGKTDRVMTNFVSGNFFSVLGLKPALGRFILPSEGELIGADPVMVLSYSYWKTHFGADPDITGKIVTLNGRPVTIVGVAPEGFDGISSIVRCQAYLPLGMAIIEGYPSDFMTNRQLRTDFLYARLRPGVSLKQAQAALDVVGQRLAQQYPETDKDRSLRIWPELRARPNPDPNNTMLIISGLFLGLAILVLLLACVNVANILLVRATVRVREMAIRSALGAARIRLIRQLVTESVVLALAGGAAGILLGLFGSSFLSSINLHFDIPLRLDFSFDWRIFAFAMAIALCTGVIVGLVPAIRASRQNLGALLHEAGRGVVQGHHRLRDVLVIAQVGGSLMLLIIATLFMRSLGKAQQSDLGFEPSGVINFSMDPTEIGFGTQQGLAYYKSLLDRVRALPGVETATAANSVPMGYFGNFDTLEVAGYTPPPNQPAPVIAYNAVLPGYLQTLKIPLLRGRTIDENDLETTPFIAVVNEAMVKRFWPNQDPIGRQFKLRGEPQHSIQVVGVTKNSRFQGFTGVINPYFYVPMAQHYLGNSLATLQVRSSVVPATMVPQVERIIDSLAPTMPVFDEQPMTQALETLNGLLLFQIGAGLAAALGLLGLTLAIVGVYGVISYSASQRTHEIGIRMAIGAQPMEILRMVFRQGLLIVGVGLVVGLAAAFASARVLKNFLVVSATDPATYLSVAAMLSLVALFACYVPARRATKIDPMVALREE